MPTARSADVSGPSSTPLEHLFRRPSWAETQFVARALRTETIGGALLLAAAALALLWANSPWHGAYAALRDLTVGPDLWHLRLGLGHWAADGALAVFFFVAGLEVKRELLVGDLRTVRKAALPVVAAACGVAVPALVYLAVVAWAGDGAASRGWAIPTATDIAFALAVLAVLGSHLPSALRSFLLTLAVVDDLIAITIIAIFYTSDLRPLPLLLALVPLGGYAFLVQRRVSRWWLLVPLALATWVLVHASGVHATVAGVLLGLTVPVRPRRTAVPAAATLGRDTDVAQRFEHLLRPLSAGLCVPLFAFFASGVTVVGGSGGGLGHALRDPVVPAVVMALVVGKFVGVLGGTWATARLTRAETDSEVGWVDVVGLALLTGIGFTVSLLVGDLAFGGSDRADHVKVGVLLGSVVAAAAAALVLVPRNRHFAELEELERRDDDEDGVPDCFEEDTGVDRVL
jgi:NhaA family Na+:H+ antiporter